ncbi:MAG: hypothetical protein WCV80_01005 [Candidatus Paceibacterota bacterium]|jgi:hypothetical protein
MKKMSVIVFVVISLFVGISLSGCVSAAIQGAFLLAGEGVGSLKTGSIDISKTLIFSKVQDKNPLYNILKITGMMRYKTATVGAEDFIDIRRSSFDFRLLNKKKKEITIISGAVTITNGLIESIEPEKIYSFEVECKVPANQSNNAVAVELKDGLVIDSGGKTYSVRYE